MKHQHSETWKSLKYSLVCFSVLLLIGCGATGENPISPLDPPSLDISLNFIDLPAEEVISGHPKTREVTLVPDKSTRLSIGFAKLEFPKGAVSVPTYIWASADKSIYAVDMGPSKTTFMLPVNVEFKLKKKDFKNDEDLMRISVYLIESDGRIEVIPHTLKVKKGNVRVFFSIDHFSRYALAVD